MTNQCDVCGKPATQWMGDPWGKSDVKRPKCAEHGIRLRDPADVAEIERLQKREKDLMDVIDSRDKALGFVPLDDLTAVEPPVQQWVWEFGRIHFHTIPGFADRLRMIVEDCQQASVIADIWLNDFGQVLKEFGYKMTITKADAAKSAEQWVDPKRTLPQCIHGNVPLLCDKCAS